MTAASKAFGSIVGVGDGVSVGVGEGEGDGVGAGAVKRNKATPNRLDNKIMKKTITSALFTAFLLLIHLP